MNSVQADQIVVSAVDQPEFQPDREAHRQFWTGRVDEVILRPYHSWGGRIPTGVVVVHRPTATLSATLDTTDSGTNWQDLVLFQLVG